MKMRDVQQRARELGIRKVVGVRKRDLIRSIQVKEGNVPCFGTASSGSCDRKDCAWYDACMKESA